MTMIDNRAEATMNEPAPTGSRRTDRGAPGRASAGFTLVEVIWVLVMLAILVGIAIPRINVARFQVDAAAMEMATATNAAQGLSVLRGHDIVLAFDESNRRVRLHQDQDSDGDVDAGEDVRWRELPEDVRFGRGSASARPLSSAAISFEEKQDGMPALIFHRNGSAGEEGVFYLTSARADVNNAFPEDARAIEIERATGRVRCFTNRTGEWEEGC